MKPHTLRVNRILNAIQSYTELPSLLKVLWAGIGSTGLAV